VQKSIAAPWVADFTQQLITQDAKQIEAQSMVALLLLQEPRKTQGES
jgi:hypothetical protein